MAARSRIAEVRLASFKAFERFRASFAGSSYIVGPNNAGKSTLISVTRTASHMLRAARNRKPNVRHVDDGVSVIGYSFNAARMDLVDANIRHEFRNDDTRMKVTFSNKSTLTATWPKQNEEELS